MTILIHPQDLTELQVHLLEIYLYHALMAESDEQEGVDMNEGKAAEQAGEQFDKIYYYDNSHNNIYSALNLKDDD